MPDLDASLLLDLLVGVVVLLFVPFGIRRGVAKEAMVAAGLLFGSALATAWGETAATWLIAELGVEAATARFAVAVAALVGGMILFGYLGGAALGRLRPGVLARIAGGILAACNGVLFLVLLMEAIERELQPGGWLDDGVVARTLLREGDWILLGIGGLLGLLVLLGLVVTSVRRRREPVYAPDSLHPLSPVPPRQRPVRFSRGGDETKYEPTPEPRPGRFGGPLAQTGHLPAEQPAAGGASSALRAPWSRERSTADGSTNGHGRAVAGDGATVPISDSDRWLRRPDPAPAVGASSVDAAEGSAGRRCPRCGAPSRSTDVFCPECGQTL